MEAVGGDLLGNLLIMASVGAEHLGDMDGEVDILHGRQQAIEDVHRGETVQLDGRDQRDLECRGLDLAVA